MGGRARAQRAHAQRWPAVRILTANIAGNEWVPALREVIGHRGPDVVIVTEAYRARRFLRSIGGYRSYQYRRWRGVEAPGIAVLVRRGHKVTHRQPMTMRRTWRFKGGRLRRPRVYPTLQVDGMPVVGVHFPPHGADGANAAAWRESWVRVSHWLERHKGAAPGDWNELRHELAALVTPPLQLIVGTKVDHLITTRDLRHVGTTRLHDEQPAGMHGWVLYSIQERDPRAGG